MSQENVEVVRRVTDVMDAEGFQAALPVFLEAAHPDVEWREDPATTSVEFFLDRAEALDAAGRRE
jgi:hypothetical protein